MPTATRGSSAQALGRQIHVAEVGLNDSPDLLAGLLIWERVVRLTTYTDYTLRVMVYLAMKYRQNENSTIDAVAEAYGISRSHLTKIINELAQNGYVLTTRGRSGGVRLARAPEAVSIGELVRMAEKDFAMVSCHEREYSGECAILPICNLRGRLAKAAGAFMMELDGMSLAEAVAAPAAPLLEGSSRTIAISAKHGRIKLRKGRADD